MAGRGVNASTPLLDTPPELYPKGVAFDRCLFQVVNQENIELTKCQSGLKSALKIATFFISASTKVFFIPVALRMPVGPLFAAGNAFGFLKLEYWAGSKTIDDMITSETPAEKALLGEKKSSCLKDFGLGVASWIIADLSQVPVALAAVVYNSKQFKVAAAVVVIVSGSFFPARSLQLSLSKGFQKKIVDDQMKKCLDLKRECLALIHSNQDLFIERGTEAQLQLIDSFDQIRALADGQDKINRYMSHMLALEEGVPKPKGRSYSEIIGGGLGIVLTGFFQTALGLYTWDKSKEQVYDNNIVAGVFTVLVATSSLYLTGKSIKNTSERVFNSISNMFTCKKQKSLAEQLRPKLTFCLQSLGLFVDIFALGPTIVIWHDYFNKNEFEQIMFQSTSGLAVFFLLFTATLDIIDDVVEKSVELKGMQNEKKIFEMKREYNRLQAIIEKSALLEFIASFSKFPQDLKDRILKRVQMTSEELNQVNVDQEV